MDDVDKLKLSDSNRFYNIIIGLAGPYGSGCSSLAEELGNYIRDWPGCHVERVRVSDLIVYWYPIIIKDSPLNFSSSSGAERRKNLQHAGTELRKMDLNFIGEAIAHYIYTRAQELEKSKELDQVKTLVFIVDSLKNLNDVNILRQIYGNEFCLCFVHANKEIRWRRMHGYKSWRLSEEEDFQKLDKIDSHEKDSMPEVGNAGQQVRKLASEADYYIVNNINREKLKEDGIRFFHLLFGNHENQPTLHERCMHLAFSASNRSYCLSRQVGAAIFDKDGNILSVGHNDAPKAGGGLYALEDKNDSRCYLVGDRRCINDINKEERFNKLTEEICENFRITSEKNDVKVLVSRSDFREATEFCRAVHAEMEAILSVARRLQGSTKGATMYVTTEPCHNCTKHIICSGISRVIYFEPYPKSLAKELHSDAIVFDPEHEDIETDKVIFIPYRGVAPGRFHDFFTMQEERKNDKGYMAIKSKVEQAESPRYVRMTRPRSRFETDYPITINELNVAAKFEEYTNNGVQQEDEHESGGEEVHN